jgi:outer membrane protein
MHVQRLIPLVLLSTMLAAPASALSLYEAIAAAYASNPEVSAARAQLRQIDETVPLALTGMRPSAGLTGGFTQELTDRFGDAGRILTGGITVRQPIWEGGRVRANVTSAEARVEAARARVRAVEYAVIVDTVTAYADVLRLAEVVALNENQVSVLGQQLRASQDRFEVGDVTPVSYTHLTLPTKA